MCLFFVLNVEKHQKCFFIKRVRFVIFVRKGISIIASALAATDKIYVYILRSKCGKMPEMFSIAILTVTSPIVINVPTRGLLAVETKDSFVLWLAKFKYQKTCL